MTERLRPPAWTIEDDLRIKIANRLYVSFQRFRRLGSSDPSTVPTSYGVAPICEIDGSGGLRAIAPLPEDEAMWIGLSPIEGDLPSAVRVVIRQPDEIDAITGSDPLTTLARSPQNYVVAPPQHIVAGVSVSPHHARQFVRLPRSSQDAACQRLELTLYAPSSLTTVQTPVASEALADRRELTEQPNSERGKGLVIQKIDPDPFRSDVWNHTAIALVSVEFAMPQTFTRLTGRPMPGELNDRSIYGGWRLP